MEGWCYKKGKGTLGGGFQRRYLRVIEENDDTGPQLQYFRRMADPSPAGAINLNDIIRVFPVDSQDLGSSKIAKMYGDHSFSVVTKDRTYHFLVDDISLVEWLVLFASRTQASIHPTFMKIPDVAKAASGLKVKGRSDASSSNSVGGSNFSPSPMKGPNYQPLEVSFDNQKGPSRHLSISFDDDSDGEDLANDYQETPKEVETKSKKSAWKAPLSMFSRSNETSTITVQNQDSNYSSSSKGSKGTSSSHTPAIEKGISRERSEINPFLATSKNTSNSEPYFAPKPIESRSERGYIPPKAYATNDPGYDEEPVFINIDANPRMPEPVRSIRDVNVGNQSREFRDSRDPTRGPISARRGRGSASNIRGSGRGGRGRPRGRGGINPRPTYRPPSSPSPRDPSPVKKGIFGFFGKKSKEGALLEEESDSLSSSGSDYSDSSDSDSDSDYSSDSSSSGSTDSSDEDRKCPCVIM